MKYNFVFVCFVCFIFLSLVANADLIFYEDFSNENLNESHVWRTSNNAYYFFDQKLNADGKRIDSTDRYISQFDYFLNFSANDLVFSFDVLLKSNGNPQEGRGVIVSLAGNKGRYDLRILNGFTSNFPINQNAFSFGYGTDSLHDMIVTTFFPQRDVFYNLKAIRNNSVWYFFVNDLLIGTKNDFLNITNFELIHVPAVGSVVIDNIYVESLSNNQNIENKTEYKKNLDEGLLKYAPVFYLHPNEYYEIREIESMLNLSDLRKNGEIIKEKPVFYNDIKELGSKYYLDLTNVDITKDELPKVSDFDNFKPVIYGRAIANNKRKYYQYFIFYPFQKRGYMSHEGDWELVQVNEDSAGKIESVHYHFDMFGLAHYNLEDLEFINKTHPVVYVALGSHNTYANQNEIIFENPYMFFQKFFTDLKKYEKISKNGSTYKPNVLELNNENEKHYEIKDIYDLPINFEGHWGQLSDNVLKQGPKGPKYNPRFYKTWREPETFAHAPDFPFFSVFLYSPVKFEIYTNDTILIDEYNENLLYLNNKNAFDDKIEDFPNSAIVKGNNFKLKLNAYSHGQFSLDIFLYDNETNKGIILSYENITTKDCSNGYLDANFESYFVLYYDSECSNNYKKFFPNKNITLNAEYTLPDKDDDGINDLSDNCVDAFNPNKNDFNNDGFGDECDNPRYYKKKALELLDYFDTKNNKSFHAIKKSLNNELWLDDFHIKSINVFLYELFAVQHIHNTELEYFLAKADKLIVEKRIFEKENIKYKNKKVKDIYEKGLYYMNKQEYKKAILYFMHAWVLINH